MAEFDRDLWKKRAWDKFCKETIASKSGRPTKAQERAWAADVWAIDDIATVIEWCKERCISVQFTRRAKGLFETDTKLISIAASARAQKQLCYLLHEAGHYLVGDKDQDPRFKMGYVCQSVPGVKNKFIHKVACLEEEFEAWHRGWKLGQRLGVKVSRGDFDKVRLNCLKTYIQWSTKRGA